MLFSYLKLKSVYSFKNFISIVQFRSLYTSSVFGLKHFESLRKETQNRAGKEFYDLKKKLEISKETKNAENLKIEELNKFLLLSKNVDPDLNLAICTFKIFLKDNFLRKERNFGELLAKTDFLLNTNDANQAIQLLNDTDIQPSFMSQISTFILMIKFYKYNHHKEVFQCFITYIEYLNENVIGLKHPIKYKLKSQQQLVPFGHLRLVTSSLLCLNTKESFEQMKIVVQLASTCKSILSNNALASCFLLSFYQNDIAFALKMVNKISSKVIKTTKTMHSFYMIQLLKYSIKESNSQKKPRSNCLLP